MSTSRKESTSALEIIAPEPIAALNMTCADAYIGRRSAGTLHVIVEAGDPCDGCMMVLDAMGLADARLWPEAHLEQGIEYCGHCDDLHTAWDLVEKVPAILVEPASEGCSGPACKAWYALRGDDLRLVVAPDTCASCRRVVESWGRIASVVFRDQPLPEATDVSRPDTSGPVWQRARDTLADLGVRNREEAAAWVADHRTARRGDSAAETDARAGLANIVENLAAIVFDAA